MNENVSYTTLIIAFCHIVNCYLWKIFAEFADFIGENCLNLSAKMCMMSMMLDKHYNFDATVRLFSKHLERFLLEI